MGENLNQVVELLRAERATEAELAESLLAKSQMHAAKVKQIDAALAALGVGGTADRSKGFRRPTSGPTAREKILALLRESQRDWTVPQMVREYEQRGEPFESENPDSTVRAALKTALKHREVVRTPQGRYIATEWLADDENQRLGEQLVDHARDVRGSLLAQVS